MNPQPPSGEREPDLPEPVDPELTELRRERRRVRGLFIGLTLVWAVSLLFTVKFGWGKGILLGRTMGLLGIAAELGLLLWGLVLIGTSSTNGADWLDDPAPQTAPQTAPQLAPQTAQQLAPQIDGEAIVIDAVAEPDAPGLPETGNGDAEASPAGLEAATFRSGGPSQA
jgi:hypothetical protein